MGVISRARLLLRIRVQTVPNELEASEQTLEYAEIRHRELLRTAGAALIDVATARQQLTRQTDALRRQLGALDDQARRAVEIERDDLARISLHRKQEARRALEDLETRIADVAAEQQALTAAHQRLAQQIEHLHARRLATTARHESAAARARAGEALLGLGPELADLSLAVGRAEERTDRLQARAAALGTLLADGGLTAPLGLTDPLDWQFRALANERAVDDDLTLLRRAASEPQTDRLRAANGENAERIP